MQVPNLIICKAECILDFGLCYFFIINDFKNVFNYALLFFQISVIPEGFFFVEIPVHVFEIVSSIRQKSTTHLVIWFF